MKRKHILISFTFCYFSVCLIWIMLFPLPYYTKYESLPSTKNCSIVITNRQTLVGCLHPGLDKWLLEIGVNSVYKRIQRMLTCVTSHGHHQPYVTLTTSGNQNWEMNLIPSVFLFCWTLFECIGITSMICTNNVISVVCLHLHFPCRHF